MTLFYLRTAEGSLNDVAQARKLRRLPRSERVALSKKSNEPLTKKNENKKR